MITFFSATIVPLAVILFVVLVFVHALVSAQQVREAEQQWSLARAFGLFFDGEYPEISLRKGEVLFEQLVMPGAKGGVAYKHQFTAPTTQFAFVKRARATATITPNAVLKKLMPHPCAAEARLASFSGCASGGINWPAGPPAGAVGTTGLGESPLKRYRSAAYISL